MHIVHMERLLWAAGVVCLAGCFVSLAGVLVARRSAAAIAREARVSVGPEDSTKSASLQLLYTGAAKSSSPAVVGRIEIPAIGMVTPLLAGDDSTSLTEGAGHIPGTAYPGGLGTVGIAGHRDTHFRLLAHVAAGMDVRLTDRTGTYHYRVSSFEIVPPEQVSVLDIVSEPGLALVTCYPFHYVGSAPKRFVVHAKLISVAPDDADAAPR